MNIKTLQSELEGKDELVQALTKQLEQVAEQLDREQRTGVRASHGGGSLPAEFAKQQVAVAQDLSYLVEQWNATQIGGSIGRLEMQLQEMRDLITQLTNSPIQSASQSQGEAFEPVQKIAAATSSSDYLASLQAAFLNPEEEAAENGSHPSDSSSANDPSQITKMVSYEELPEQPEPIDFDLASPEDLQGAILKRDNYIEIVIDQLRQARTQDGLQSPVNWEALQACPADLVQRVQELEQQLEAQLRLSEVSMSLERARLSREETQLNTARIQMQKELRKQGIDPQIIPGLNLRAEIEDVTEVVKEKTKGAKWLNMLRANGKS